MADDVLALTDQNGRNAGRGTTLIGGPLADALRLGLS